MERHPARLDLDETAMNGPFRKDYKITSRARTTTVSSVSPSLDSTLKEYEEFLNRKIDVWSRSEGLKGIQSSLSAEDWERFISVIASFERQPHYQANTGYFIAKVLTNSYVAGLREATLDFEGCKPLKMVGFYFPCRTSLYEKLLDSPIQDPLSLTIKGMVGSNAFGMARYVHLLLDEAGSHLCYQAYGCKITIKKAGPYSFLALGNTEVTIDDAEEPQTLSGSALGYWGDDIVPYNIKVKTSNVSLIEPFKMNISKVENGELYFIDSQGNEERVV